MRRIPIIATLIVALALAAMIALGFWQLHRAHWKDAMLVSYRAALGAPDMEGLPQGVAVDRLAFRRVHALCRVTTEATLLGGADAVGRTGFRNVVGCALADGRSIMADLGWGAVDARPVLPSIGQQIDGIGRLIPADGLARRVIGEGGGVVPLLLVLDKGMAGLKPSVAPSIEMIPNNHLSYAVQWFLFAAVALVIYGLALWKRNGGR